jgi:hypothetical protein
MNEATWQTVHDWEQLHCEECKHAQLLRFQGRPHDLRWASSSSSSSSNGSTAATAGMAVLEAVATASSVKLVRLRRSQVANKLYIGRGSALSCARRVSGAHHAACMCYIISRITC